MMRVAFTADGGAATGAAHGSVRKEVSYAHPGHEERILAVAASPLVVPDAGPSGHVYTFLALIAIASAAAVEAGSLQ